MLRAVIIRCLILVVFILVAYGVMLFFAQDGMIYQAPPAYSAAELKRFRSDGLERIDFETSSGGQVAFYKGASGGVSPDRIWLVFSGNGGRACDYADVTQAGNWAYLFVDYPGYGLCEGSPSPKRIDAAVDGAIAALGEKLGLGEEQLSEKLCVLGHSLGAAVGLRAAVRHQIDTVVALAPFTTMKEMAARTVGGLYSNVLRHRFDNVAALRALEEGNPDAEVTIMSGSDDRMIPPSMGRRLAEQFPGIAEFRPLDGVGHNNIFDHRMEEVRSAMRGE